MVSKVMFISQCALWCASRVPVVYRVSATAKCPFWYSACNVYFSVLAVLFSMHPLLSLPVLLRCVIWCDCGWNKAETMLGTRYYLHIKTSRQIRNPKPDFYTQWMSDWRTASSFFAFSVSKENNSTKYSHTMYTLKSCK